MWLLKNFKLSMWLAPHVVKWSPSGWNTLAALDKNISNNHFGEMAFPTATPPPKVICFNSGTCLGPASTANLAPPALLTHSSGKQPRG